MTYASRRCLLAGSSGSDVRFCVGLNNEHLAGRVGLSHRPAAEPAVDVGVIAEDQSKVALHAPLLALEQSRQLLLVAGHVPGGDVLHLLHSRAASGSSSATAAAGAHVDDAVVGQLG